MVQTLSRRGFLQASAGTAAAAALGGFSYEAWQQQAFAKDSSSDVVVRASTCNSCSNKCGMHVYSKNGRLWKVVGDKDHPYSKGTLCARGHGFATIAYNEARVTQPMKKNADGVHEPISWEQAYQEIGAKVKEIIADKGAQALAIVQDPRPSGEFYSKHFMNALGSPNVYTHGVACNMSCKSAYTHLMGSEPSPDISNAEVVMFIGRSYADGIRPSAQRALSNAVKEGLKVIVVDPRFNSMAHQATEWLPIRPGTDLALLLAMCNILISEDLYNHDFVAEHTEGFEEFAEAIKEYTPAWASKITTLPEEQIVRVTKLMAAHAPKAFIEQTWRAALGCSYKNSMEGARVLMMVNALLGCFGEKGGMYYGVSPKLGDLTGDKFKPLPKIEAKKYGVSEFPLASTSMGIANMVAKGAERGDIKGAFFYHSNAIMGYSNPAKLQEALSHLDLMVSIEIQMTETALAADYILPDTTYIERREVPAVVGGKSPIVDLRLQGIDKVWEDTRPVDQIFTELAQACGVGEYFTFTLDDVIDARLSALDPAVAAKVKEKGIAKVDMKFSYPGAKNFEFKSADKKLHFADDVWTKAGLKRVPQWIEPLKMPDPTKADEFRLIAGKEPVHTHTSTTNIPHLIQITKDYGLERVWMNAQRAEALGIKDGDMIEISSEFHTDQVRCRVTQRLHPDCIWTPSHYGVKSEFLKAGKGIGIASMDHTDYHFGPYDGAAMTQENIVHVKKVEA